MERLIRNSFKGTFLIIILMITLVSFSQVTRPAQAQDNLEQKINNAALALYHDNIANGSFTHWIGGNIGGQALESPKVLRPGQLLPVFKFKWLSRPLNLSSGDLNGSYIIYLWSSWCAFSQQEFARVIQASVQDWSVPVLFVDAYDESTKANTFLAPYRTD